MFCPARSLSNASSGGWTHQHAGRPRLHRREKPLRHNTRPPFPPRASTQRSVARSRTPRASNAGNTETSLKQRLGEGLKAFGGIVLTSSPVVVEVLGSTRLDFLVIDMEHSPIATGELYPMLLAAAAARVPALVRVPCNDEVVLKKVLDLGPAGVIVPLVNSAEEARHAARACSYPPQGSRGVAYPLVRASRYGANLTYSSCCREELLMLVQIESVAAVDALPDILGIDGVDGIFVGPLDLSGSVGQLGEVDSPEVQALMRHIEEVAQGSQKVLAGFCAGKRSAGDLFDAGYAMVTGVADVALLREGAMNAVKTAAVSRNIAPRPSGPPAH